MKKHYRVAFTVQVARLFHGESDFEDEGGPRTVNLEVHAEGTDDAARLIGRAIEALVNSTRALT